MQATQIESPRNSSFTSWLSVGPFPGAESRFYLWSTTGPTFAGTLGPGPWVRPSMNFCKINKLRARLTLGEGPWGATPAVLSRRDGRKRHPVALSANQSHTHSERDGVLVVGCSTGPGAKRNQIGRQKPGLPGLPGPLGARLGKMSVFEVAFLRMGCQQIPVVPVLPAG